MKKILIGIIAILAFIVALGYLTFRSDQESLKYAYIPSALVDAPSVIASDSFRNSNITPIPFVTGRETVQSLLSDSVFAATLAEWPFLLASNERSDLRIVAVITKADSLGLLASRSSGVTGEQDLAGKTVGFPFGTSAQYLYETYFNKAGNLQQIRPVNLPPPQLQPALERGDISAMAVWQPFLERARVTNPDDFFYLDQSQKTFGVIYCIVTTEENLQKHAASIRSILNSLIEAEQDLSNLDDKTLMKLADATNLELNTLEEILPLFNFRTTLDGTLIETLEKLAVWAHESGLAEESILNRDWLEFIAPAPLSEIDPERVSL